MKSRQPSPEEFDALVQAVKILTDQVDRQAAQLDATVTVIEGMQEIFKEITAVLTDVAKHVDNAETQERANGSLDRVREWLALAITTLGTLMK